MYTYLIYIAPTFIVSSCDIYTHTFNFHILACGQYKNVRGICLSHTNTFFSHPSNIYWVRYGFFLLLHNSLFAFSFYDFCSATILCHNIALPVLQYIHIHICMFIYIHIDSYIVLRKSFAFKRQKVLRFRTITSNKTAGCKRRSISHFPLPPLIPFSTQYSINSCHYLLWVSVCMCVCVGVNVTAKTHTHLHSIWARSIYNWAVFYLPLA